MARIARSMESSLKVTGERLPVTDYVWRLALLILPWQTRWFFGTQMIGGYPWEQGRLSFYVSWIPMILLMVMAIPVALRKHLQKIPPLLTGTEKIFEWKGTAVYRRLATPATIVRRVGIVFFVLASFFTLSPRATVEWWVEVLVLVGFVGSLRLFQVDRRSFAVWSALSLIPHAFLGLVQFFTQTVVGSKWLGMAAQITSTPGASVIFHEGERVLRAYGGFPHPNILGGWLAIIILIVLGMKKRSAAFAAGLFSIVLVLTFSRGAWIALVIGFIFMMVGAHGMRSGRTSPAPTRIMFVVLIFTLAATVFIQRSLFVGRIDTQRALEMTSVNERIIGLQNGWRLFREHPLVGVGPGATALMLDSQLIPHFVPLLALDEVGLAGVIGLMLFLFSLRHRRPFAVTAPLVALLIFSLFDHFPWSLWSGKALAAIVFALILLEKKTPEPGLLEAKKSP